MINDREWAAALTVVIAKDLERSERATDVLPLYADHSPYPPHKPKKFKRSQRR